MRRELTGRHVLFIVLASFGVIVGVNLLLAWQAVATFPGLEVRNGYVASQNFDAERRAQRALGWQVRTRLESGVLTVSFAGPDGRPAEVASVSAVLGRATNAADDQAPAFEAVDRGLFRAPVEVERGQWVLQLRAVAADGTAFRQRVSVSVRE